MRRPIRCGSGLLIYKVYKDNYDVGCVIVLKLAHA